MKNKIIFILAAARSGSTLLDKSLGTHPDCLSLGEIINISNEFKKNKTLCGCGQWLVNCKFWSIISKEISSKYNIPTLSFLNLKYEKSKPSLIYKVHLIKDLLFSNNKSKENIFHRTKILFDILISSTKKSTLIDSSKAITRSLLLSYYLKNYDVYYIHLIREGKAVLNSQKKCSYRVYLPEGYTKEYSKQMEESNIEELIESWINYNKKVNKYLKIIPKSKKIKLKYEDFIKAPEVILNQIYTKFGLTPQLYDTEFLKLNTNHIIGGNPSRINAKRIINDQTNDYLYLTENDIMLFKEKADRYAKKFGY